MLIEQMNSREYYRSMLLFTAALRELNTKFEIINEEFAIRLKSNPIEHIKSRLKTSHSIAKKLTKKGYEPTLENALKYIDDIAGIRIICSFTEDIYRIATVVQAQSYINVLKIKDYILTPKENGYRSYHMIVEVPVFLSGKKEMTRVEIQIRTIAMDFWASLEHKIRYKFESDVPQSINDDLLECANIISSLDEKMLSLNNEIEGYKPEKK
ncbi:MAG TPA: GTP pyrophosphokinase family protein [Candidatus Ornithomonoglobus intestinigallinarum]|uniref:GTP pyrophosphokinase family protein n=1 Tax=Candidatus Ornithomonoglobus intestinigallinarum TaxID=2840894 RepID=A0A9D1H2V6_9FIRM|nr:GTP pyrophosphokinase family protein [Candidatus Ornithomonoglobus intestinigallinarum]